MTDIQKLKRLAEAATPGRIHDRLDSCGGGLKYECFGDDGSLVLKVDHKNDEFGFVGDRGEQDEAFFLACTPAAVLELVSRIEALEESRVRAMALIETLESQQAGLKGAVEILERDAQRYRWLRNKHLPLDGHDFLSTQEILDRRIDAAMSKEATQ